MHWSAVTLFILTTLGHFALVVLSLNLIFRRGPSEWLWTVLVLAHGLALVFVPAWLLWAVYLRGPGVLRTGDLAALPWLAWAYTAVALATLAYAGWFVLAARRAGRPAALRSNHTHVVDVAKELGGPPAGGGFRGALARLPFNDLFELELTEKELVLPRLPEAWDGLTILHVTDVHLKGTPNRAFFERAFDLARGRWRPDVVAFTGDLVDDPAKVEWIAPTLGQLEAPIGKFFILGNHDALGDPAPTRRALAELGWTDVAGRHVTVDCRGHGLLIAGSEYPWMGKHPDLPAEVAGAGSAPGAAASAPDLSAAAAAAAAAADRPDGPFRLLLAHDPHAIKWARRRGVDLVLAGHLHGGQVRVWPVGPVIGGRFAAGTFVESPTVMHVSKGLGALTPIRYRCRPDLTLLRLRRG